MKPRIDGVFQKEKYSPGLKDSSDLYLIHGILVVVVRRQIGQLPDWNKLARVGCLMASWDKWRIGRDT